MGLNTISLCMIVKNEEKNLANCLDSVAGVPDEIIIVDTGSADNTVEIAKRYTDKVYFFEWIDDFSAARNFSFSKAKMDFIFWLDGDDTLPAESRDKLIALKKKLKNVDVVTMPYHYWHDDDGNVLISQIRERLFRRSCGFVWKGAIHENVPVHGGILDSDIPVTHDRKKLNKDRNEIKERNLRILQKTINSESYDVKDLYYYALSLHNDGQSEKALVYLNRFFEISHEFAITGVNAYLTAHHIYLAKGDNNAALKILLDNESKLNHKSEFFCTVGDFYANTQSDIKKACEYYMQALQADGVEKSGVRADINEYYYYYIPCKKLGEIFFSADMYAEALEYYQKALHYRPNDKTIEELTVLLTQICEKLGYSTKEGMNSGLH
jgi:glycosyltransferase involved in cell wall biosynthesis